ncbi:lipoyl amidotransferase LIPT1, mitochondrial-like [Ornithodoros turicata]|uniref:lipoyl amidotransferase LIPT1, mitochondrial-like n=1 Tax=Ornithodoros turicata TaxID=34597 RepID=UPI0031387895
MHLFKTLLAKVAQVPLGSFPFGVNNHVLVSQSRCIFENLALEQWLYEHVEFTPGSPGLLLMWWNEPAVVIGRHQNPWIECSVKNAADLGVNLARRNSGGGTVYHDLGNLNCCFMGHKADYNRKNNLRIICDALQTCWKVRAEISDRDDILVQDTFKISGTAAKISHNTAYHHCTVLVDVNTTVLHQVLEPIFKNFESKATTSVRASVRNLKEICPHMTLEDLAETVGQAYNEYFSTGTDSQLALEPSKNQFSEIEATKQHLMSWDWVFGMTPRFTAYDSFHMPPSLYSGVDIGDSFYHAVLKISLTAYHGKLEDVRFTPHLRNRSLECTIKKCLGGVRFRQDDIRTVFSQLASFESVEEENEDTAELLKFVGNSVCAVVGNACR